MTFNLPGSLLVFLVAVSLGSLTTMSLSVLGVVLGVSAVGFSVIYLILHPQRGLVVSFLLVILADTKFRGRDSALLLSGDIDTQIIFELVLYGVISLIIVSNLFSSSFRHQKSTSMERVLFGYVVLAFGSSLWSAAFHLTAVRATQLFILYGLCFVAIRVLTPQRVVRTLAASVIFYVLVCSSMALTFPWANGTQLTHVTQLSRFSWFVVHPIIAASYAATGGIFLLSEALFARGSWRERIMGVPLWLYTVPLGLVLMATRSRGPLIAFAVAILVLLIKKFVNPLMVGVVGYVSLAVLVSSLGFGFSVKGTMESVLNNDNTLSVFLSRGQTVEEVLSVSGRTELWQGVYTLFLERPILGYGYVASREVLPGVLSWSKHAHNAFAESLLNLGLVGTGLIWFALGRTLLSSLRQTFRAAEFVASHQAAVSGVLVFLLVYSFVHTSFSGVPSYEILLLFGSVLAHDRLRELQQSEKKKSKWFYNCQSWLPAGQRLAGRHAITDKFSYRARGL